MTSLWARHLPRLVLEAAIRGIVMRIASDITVKDSTSKRNEANKNI